MSLADELAADLQLDESYQPQTKDIDDDFQEEPQGEHSEYEDVEMTDTVEDLILKHIDDVRKVAKMMNSSQMKEVLRKIDDFRTSETMTLNAHVEDEPEYQLIVSANTVAADIDTEIAVVHKFIRDHYSSKFAELERLVTNPLDYVKTVKMIANETDILNVNLDSILPRGTKMMVHVAAATSNSEPLPPPEWAAVDHACHMALDLDAARTKLMDYVESRMSFMAPNLCALLGSRTAAQLLGAAGGLSGLTKMPSCNIPLLGSEKRTSESVGGLGAAVTKPHTGFIYRSLNVQRLPTDIRRKAQKLFAAKAGLAARIDQSREYHDGSYGQRLKEEIEGKIEKVLEPPALAQVRPLPVPGDGPKKRRGGRKARAAKGKYAMTELSKAQNRMAFGAPEEEILVGDETEGLGMVGQSSGRIRAAVVDSRSKAKLSKVTKTRQLRYASSSSAVSGLASSVAFTPVQGIELINPSKLQEKKEQTKGRYV